MHNCLCFHLLYSGQSTRIIFKVVCTFYKTLTFHTNATIYDILIIFFEKADKRFTWRAEQTINKNETWILIFETRKITKN